MKAKLEKMTDLGYEPVYIDEIMFTSKTNHQMTWAARREPILIDRKLTEVDPIACVAAISASNGVELVKQYDKSVDKFKFEEFLKELRSRIGDRKVVLVLDNLNVHTCPYTQHRMSLHEFKWAYTPIYYPDANPIETVFAMVKRKYRKFKLRNIVDNLEESPEEMINRYFAIVTK